MTHIGQELALGLVGGFGRLLGPGQLDGPFPHSTVNEGQSVRPVLVLGPAEHFGRS